MADGRGKRAAGAWVVTGAGSGLGREFAVRLALRGESLALWDRDPDGLEQTKRLLGGARTHTTVMDVTDPSAAAQAVASARDALGPIGHLVHCAGILRTGPAETMAPVEFRSMIEVNYLGTVHVACALVPELRDAAQTGGKATMMLIASVAGLRGFPDLAGYSASKHAVVGFAQALRDELSGSGIDVRVLCPPAADTPMVRNLESVPKIYKLSPLVNAETVVTGALAALEGDAFIVLIDTRSRAMWRVGQLAPGVIDLLVRRTTKPRRR